jgi:hypothetical protein
MELLTVGLKENISHDLNYCEWDLHETGEDGEAQPRKF